MDFSVRDQRVSLDVFKGTLHPGTSPDMHSATKENHPFVSVIMPVRNEAGFIAKSLNAVLKQDYPAYLMEVIVADGMSEDHTRKIVREVIRGNSGGISLILIDNRGRIAPCGLNAATRIAKGEIIIRIDGHCEISNNYVSSCVRHLLNEKVDGVGGPIETIGETELSETIAVAMSSVFGVGGSAFRTVKDRSMLVDTVAFPAYTRQIVEKAGFYDEELIRNQDDEYNYRIRKLGGKILLAPEIKSRYYSRGTLKKLCSQYFQYGYWKVRVLQKHPRQMSLRQFVPPAFVLSLISFGFLAPFSAIATNFLYAVLISYALANLSASVITAAQRGWKHLPLLPLVFAILHVSYGLGFLTGLVRFANRWGHVRDSISQS